VGNPVCEVRYTKSGSWWGAFIAQVQVKNISQERITGWTVRWDFAGDENVRYLWGGDATQTGARVKVDNARYNRTIRPGRTISFGFLGQSSHGPLDIDEFALNGAACVVVH